MPCHSKSYDKVTSWPQLIPKFLVAQACLAMLLLIGPALFIYTQGVLFTTFCKYTTTLRKDSCYFELKNSSLHFFNFQCRSRVIHQYRLAMHLKVYGNHMKGSKLWQLCIGLRAFVKHIQVQAEISMRGRAYNGKVLTQVWLKMNELFNEQVNVQK